MNLAQYSSMLREELIVRCRKNPSYSARAMARDMGISPAYLSQVLSHKKMLNEDRAFHIAQALKWDLKKSRVFTTLVRFESAKDPKTKEIILDELNKIRGSQKIAFYDLQLDSFRIISDWYHFAILELTCIKGFRSNPHWIANKLGITPSETVQAIERLKRLDLLKETNRRITKTKEDYTTPSAPSAAIRGFHRQILEKAKLALVHQSVETRHFTGATMAIDPARLDEAREKVAMFRNELMQFLEKGQKTAVYQLSLQLFRLDQK